MTDLLVNHPPYQERRTTQRKRLESEVSTAKGAPAPVLKTTISGSLDLKCGADQPLYSIDHDTSVTERLSRTVATWREVVPPNWMENSSSTAEPYLKQPAEKPLNPSPKSKYI